MSVSHEMWCKPSSQNISIKRELKAIAVPEDLWSIPPASKNISIKRELKDLAVEVGQYHSLAT